jgi:hypothetical protein
VDAAEDRAGDRLVAARRRASASPGCRGRGGSRR